MPRHPNASTEEILEITVQLIAKYDVSGVTIDMVSEKAGVSKATIYRRWSSRNALILDALTVMHRPGTNPDTANPDTGNLRDDLAILLRELVDFLNRKNGGKVFAAFLNEAVRNPKVSAANRVITQGVRTSYETVIAKAIERGELPDHVDTSLMIDLLISPFLYRRLVDITRAETADIEPLLDVVLKGMR